MQNIWSEILWNLVDVKLMELNVNTKQEGKLRTFQCKCRLPGWHTQESVEVSRCVSIESFNIAEGWAICSPTCCRSVSGEKTFMFIIQKACLVWCVLKYLVSKQRSITVRLVCFADPQCTKPVVLWEPEGIRKGRHKQKPGLALYKSRSKSS